MNRGSSTRTNEQLIYCPDSRTTSHTSTPALLPYIPRHGYGLFVQDFATPDIPQNVALDPRGDICYFNLVGFFISPSLPSIVTTSVFRITTLSIPYVRLG